MGEVQPRFQFRLRQLLWTVVAAAILLGAYRTNWGLFLLLTWEAYAWILICFMALYKWSDIAVSVGFLLIILPPVVAFFMSSNLG